MERGSIRYTVCDSKDPEGIIDALIMESALLLDGDATTDSGGEASTSIFIAQGIGCGALGLQQWCELDAWFENFLDEDELEEESESLFGGQLSCAFFHPSWRFNGIEETDAVNFERRAPFPVVSLLKKADIKSIVDEGLSRGIAISEEIHQNNQAMLRRHGYDELSRLSEELTPRS
eukprot:CAMPEP_0185780914 /NCGR_PEP_ID=MMETSP1174-20130828/100608_1 /TAXON_ID=35687 /ORGANISM="Dictyocha speculum, Strain CCMP1381" /LENGTH=175 /DNA_ID=CAMNT_0028470677 /DNA_START=266 /DNA_END=793 /DNA_ORIENTATION=-